MRKLGNLKFIFLFGDLFLIMISYNCFFFKYNDNINIINIMELFCFLQRIDY